MTYAYTFLGNKSRLNNDWIQCHGYYLKRFQTLQICSLLLQRIVVDYTDIYIPFTHIYSLSQVFQALQVESPLPKTTTLNYKGHSYMYRYSLPEAALQKCSYEKVFWKYAVKLQANTHAKERFQLSCFATLLKSHFGTGVLLYCIFSEHLFLRTPLKGCFCIAQITVLFSNSDNHQILNNSFQS